MQARSHPEFPYLPWAALCSEQGLLYYSKHGAFSLKLASTLLTYSTGETSFCKSTKTFLQKYMFINIYGLTLLARMPDCRLVLIF